MKSITVPFTKLKKIIHVSDIHIRLFKRHQEYREVFNAFFTDLQSQKLKDTVIVVAGDVLHAKNDLSPEAIELTSYFLTGLADIAPTLVILGNHDLNLSNSSRLDALSPIINNINHPNLHFLRESGWWNVGDTDVAVMSLVGDRSEWPTAHQSTAFNKVALFHGPVYGATTDVGYTITDKHVNVGTFDGFDFVILGDIHSFQDLNEAGDMPVVYSSSLIQQNHGEKPTDHGYVEWNVPQRSYTFHEVHNDYGYYTLRIVDGVVPLTDDMPKNVRLRIFAGDMDPTEIKKLVAKLRLSHNIVELSISKFNSPVKGNGTLDQHNASVLDVYNVESQTKLIHTFLQQSAPDISDEVLAQITVLNKELNSEVVSDDPTRRLVWTPLSLEFDNLFTYGENNTIDFTNMKGLVGLFAPSASGKSSIPDAISFALYDRTPRTTKAAHIMNTASTTCQCKFTFSVGTDVFVIERSGTKNKKGEVKMDVNFYQRLHDGSTVSLNGTERRYTNHNIRAYVGDYEDFVLTAFSAQTQNGLFIDRGQSDRKDTLSQFMGLTIFDKLHTLANDRSKDTLSQLKKFHNDDFTQELVDVKESIIEIAQRCTEKQTLIEGVAHETTELGNAISEKHADKTPITVTATNINQLTTDLSSALPMVDAYKFEWETIRADLTQLSAKLEVGKEKLQSKYANVPAQHATYKELQGKLQALVLQSARGVDTINKHQTTKTKLSSVKYDPSCEYCLSSNKSTIDMLRDIDGYIAEAEVASQEIATQLVTLTKDVSALQDLDIEDQYVKYTTGVKWITDTTNAVATLTLNESRLAKKFSDTTHQIETLTRHIEEYRKAEDDILRNAQIDAVIKTMDGQKSILVQQSRQVQGELNQLIAQKAVAENRQNDLVQRIKDAKALEVAAKAYQAYLAAVCRDGLPYQLISQVLPQVEVEVNNILSQMVEFTVVFDVDGKNINGRIVYDDVRTWPLELASGMEKFVTGLAIRVALMSVSSLPKTNFLIVDEGISVCDSDSLGSLFMLFDMLKTQFDFILLISHLDIVRDISDTLIDIRRENGRSQVMF